MTPTTGHPQMLVEEFEQLARTAPETVRLEFINGKLEVKPVPDGDHDEIIMWVADQCMRHRPDCRLYRERGLKIDAYRRGRARPDGALAPRKHFSGHREWSDPDGVLMVVEVTSPDSDGDRRDRVEKRDGYAAAAIPFYLLIDREEGTVTLHSDPAGGRYRKRVTQPFGAVIEIPEPAKITLDTEEFKEFSD